MFFIRSVLTCNGYHIDCKQVLVGIVRIGSIPVLRDVRNTGVSQIITPIAAKLHGCRAIDPCSDNACVTIVIIVIAT